MGIYIQRVNCALLLLAPLVLPALLRRQRRAPQPGCNGEEGQALIFVAMLMTVLMLFTGLVIDYGRGAVKHRDAQNAADAAALDAAYQIYAAQSEGTATTQAQSIVSKHGFPSSDLTTLTFLNGGGQPTIDASAVKSVNAVVTDTFPTLLMRLVGLSSTTVNAAASAVVSASGSGPCAICVMEPHAAHAFEQIGHATTTVNGGGGVVVNSDATQAAFLQGNTHVTADSVGIVGNYGTRGPASFSPNPVTGITLIPDPLANVPVPTCPSGNPTGQGAYSGSGTISPGTYTSISAGGNSGLTLSPGVYCITGSVGGGGTGQFNGNGVMLYFTCGTYVSPTACTPGQTGAGFQMTGTPNYNITAPTSGPYQGLSIFYDRNNVASFGLKGDAGDSLTGTIYAKSAAMNFVGNAHMSQLDSRIIVGTLYLQGNAGLADSYNYAANYQRATLPALSQ
ncbi:MAG: pilus assembly protein TadG-related protein [Chloroflexota bacterium]|nr:pilus assembly protein TadG-related protein [Chloroflexota bacterium]